MSSNHIKAQGKNILANSKVQTCQLSTEERNVLPQLPECDFICQWEDCERNNEVFDEPIKYYWHVQWHPEVYRKELKLKHGKMTKPEKYDCKWNNCVFKAGTISKLVKLAINVWIVLALGGHNTLEPF